MKLNKNIKAAIIAVAVIIIAVVAGYMIVLKGRYYKLDGGFVYDKWTDKICAPKR
jgi:hypothetical protein